MSITRRTAIFMGVSAVFLAALPAVAAAPAGKMIVDIEGFRNTKGQALISIYNNDDFPDLDDAVLTLKRPIKGSKMTVEFPKLTQGMWAVSVVHDENKDGDMNQWLGFGPPKEGVGATNNPDGIPKWKKCRVKMGSSDRRFKIKMVYLGKD